MSREHDDMDGWVEPDKYICRNCQRPIELPKYDGPYQYFETTDLHGQICTECGSQLCDDCADWQKGKTNNIVCFECFDKERHSRIDLSIHNAIVFAARKHDKQYRKSTDIPYISHLMEVMQILIENNCEDEVVIAGILHDTLEDTNTSPDEIRSSFGKKVLSIVQSESEDKSKEWIDRKLESIAHIRSASVECKLVCCADKLSNIRSIYADLKTIGEKVWDRFNADKTNIKRYYEGILAAISDISDCDMYLALSETVEDVFTLEWGKNHR